MVPDNMTVPGSVVLSIIYMIFTFIVLLAISYLVDITAFFLNRKKGKNKKDSGSDEPKGSVPPSSDDRGARLSPLKIAAITAAVQAYAGDGATLVVRRIHRESSGLTGWEAAGIRESLRRSL
ncbi:MAG TPA: OadG family protein [Bacillota bacterium]|jgi:hypothetical protein|nr:OadG family protein [Bacillota bacterium]HQC47903.1 OadG family protein [Bacillota bacterium]